MNVSSQVASQFKTYIPSQQYIAINNCLEKFSSGQLRISYCKI